MNTQNNNKVEQMIDLLQSHIRNGFTVPEFIKQQTRLVNTERQLSSNEESKTESKTSDFELDLEITGSDGFNCFHVACGSGHIEMVKYLLNTRQVQTQLDLISFRRMNPNTKGKEGWTALEIAATSGVLEVIQMLLADKRTVVMATSTRGCALHLAAQITNGFKICQTLLLENPKLLLVKDAEGRTPIDVCTTQNLKDLFLRYSKNLKD